MLSLADAPRVLAELAQTIELALSTPLLGNFAFYAIIQEEEQADILKIAFDLNLNATILYLKHEEKRQGKRLPITLIKRVPLLTIRAHSLELSPLSWTDESLVFELQPEDVSSKPSPKMPKWYRCCRCKGSHRKLYTFKDDQSKQMLECATCAAKSVGIQIEHMLPNGRHSQEHGGLTMSIGDFRPAIPTQDGKDIIWDMQMPQAWWLWWETLPNGILPLSIK